MQRRQTGALALGILVALLTAEVILRLQQAVGPSIDLNFSTAESLIAGQSDRINHRPLQENPYKVNGIGEWVFHYDEHGLRQNALRPPCPDDKPMLRVLFMGDSFMQGYDDSSTIPQAAWNWLRRQGTQTCLEFYNAGFWSYAPSIYIVQARDLLPRLRPDLVVVDLDETDLMDDWIRYHDLVIHGPDGGIAAVRATPQEWQKAQRLISIRQQCFFTTRLLSLLYYTRITLPAATRDHRRRVAGYGPTPPLALSRYEGDDRESHFSDEINNFRSNLTELAQVLVAGVREPQRATLAYHPHYLHLAPDDDGFRYPRTIPDLVGQAAMQNGISFVDASQELATRCQPHIADCFLWPWDPYSHFTPKGIRLYGEILAERLLPFVEAADGRRGQRAPNK